MPTTVEQFETREKWLLARKRTPEGGFRIGCSDIMAVLGKDRFKSPRALYEDVLGDIPPEDLSGNIPVQVGIATEAENRRQYERKTGRTVRQESPFVIVSNSTMPYLGATLDGDIDPFNGNGVGVFEAKFVTSGRAHAWHDEPPLDNQVQIQAQLAVTGRQWGSLSAIIGGRDYRYYDVDRNEAFLLSLLPKIKEFVERLKNQDPPPVDGLPSTTRVLKLLWPDVDGTDIVLAPVFEDMHRQLGEIDAEIGCLKETKERFRNAVKEKMGRAKFGYLPDGQVGFTRSHVSRKGHEVKPTQFVKLTRNKPKEIE